MIFASQVLREQVIDLQRRLDLATADIRTLHDDLKTAYRALADLAKQPHQSQHAPTPSDADNVMAGLVLPSAVMDEIELAAPNAQMARYLETWARSELARGTAIAAVVERIRDGDDAVAPPERDE